MCPLTNSLLSMTAKIFIITINLFPRQNTSDNLSLEGYQVVSVCFEQLAKIHHFETLALDIASRVGKKIRIRARKFFEGFAALRDLMLKGAKACRSRAKKVLFHEVPKFPGVRKIYDVYELAWRKFCDYPKRSLLITRAT